PGMVHTAILGRRLKRPVINLGFSGNGRCEPEVVDLLAQIDASAYVIDPLPNMTDQQVDERMQPLVRTLRAAHPQTPIVLVENIFPQNAVFRRDAVEGWATKNQALRNAHDRLQAAGVSGLSFIEGRDLFGHDGDAT